MNYEAFKSAALQSVQEYFGADVAVSLHSITKNNGIRLDGITFQEKSVNISPAIYLEGYYKDYQNGRSLAAVTEDIAAAYRSHKAQGQVDLSFFTDYEKVKYHIIYKLVNYEKNRELLEDVPFFRYLDLAIVFCCLLLDTPVGHATVLIHNNHLDYWGVTPDQIFDRARENTPLLLPWEINDLRNILKGFGINTDAGFLCEEAGLPSLYVLTNNAGLYGASCILYPFILKNFADSAGSDLCILPSSIHEVLLIPALPTFQPGDLDEIIQEVNAAQLKEEEILSDHAYYYRRDEGFVTDSAGSLPNGEELSQTARSRRQKRI